MMKIKKFNSKIIKKLEKFESTNKLIVNKELKDVKNKIYKMFIREKLKCNI